MQRALRRRDSVVYHIIDGIRVDGPPLGVRGDLSGVRGNLSGVRGDLSGVCGNLSGVWGDLSGVWGNINECGLTEADRERGVDVADLIREDATAETPGT